MKLTSISATIVLMTWLLGSNRSILRVTPDQDSSKWERFSVKVDSRTVRYAVPGNVQPGSMAAPSEQSLRAPVSLTKLYYDYVSNSWSPAECLVILAVNVYDTKADRMELPFKERVLKDLGYDAIPDDSKVLLEVTSEERIGDMDWLRISLREKPPGSRTVSDCYYSPNGVESYISLCGSFRPSLADDPDRLLERRELVERIASTVSVK